MSERDRSPHTSLPGWHELWPAAAGKGEPRPGEGDGEVLAWSEALVLVRSSATAELFSVDLQTGARTGLVDGVSPLWPMGAGHDRSTGLLCCALADSSDLCVLEPRSGGRLRLALPDDCSILRAIDDRRMVFDWRGGRKVVDFTGSLSGPATRAATAHPGLLHTVCALETTARGEVRWASGTFLMATHEGAIECWDSDLTMPDHASYRDVWIDVPGFHAALVGHDGAILDLHVSPDGFHLASTGADATARLWRWPTARCERVFPLDEPAERVCFVPPERLYTQSPGALCGWNAATGECLGRLPLDRRVRALEPVGTDGVLLVQEGPLAAGQGVRRLRLGGG